MGFATAAIIAGAAITAGAAVYSANKASSAQEEAVNKQLEALDATQRFTYTHVDPKRLNEAAVRADVERAKNRLALQQSVDPGSAQLRKAAQEQLLTDLQKGPGEADKLASILYNENKDQDPRIIELKNQLIDQANSELSAGATLPAEFQAELVRSGLETSGRAGTGTSGSGIAGQNVRRLVGSQGIALQQSRQNQAVKLASAANDITNARANLLAGIFPRLADLRAQNRGAATSALTIADSALPQAGLSGQDVVNLELARVNNQNKLTSQSADIAANAAIARGQLQQQLIGTVGGTIGSTVGTLGAAYANRPTAPTQFNAPLNGTLSPAQQYYV